ncbi:subtilisin-like protein [Coprinopsis marcescibilis]|uniref:Subtilisin-like protein n=1 Tax=Coprinopsis marcescibilis TaxID=230819 RepID=A0A5C3KHU4_COPMA|nr:subtilisin-like protein [Coprinopsis marcescibilis]
MSPRITTLVPSYFATNGSTISGRSVTGTSRAKSALNTHRPTEVENTEWNNEALGTSSAVKAFDYFAKQVFITKRPSITYFQGIEYGTSQAIDQAVENESSFGCLVPTIALTWTSTYLIKLGVHIVIAAGDYTIDVRDSPGISPATLSSVITVGLVNINDSYALTSNYGPSIDLWAPGINRIGSFSGTPRAAAYVAGIIAYRISKDGNSTPAAIKARLQELSVKGAIRGLPEGSDSNNFLAQLGPI